MGYHLNAVLGEYKRLQAAASAMPPAVVVPLTSELGLIPLSEDLFDAINQNSTENYEEAKPQTFTYLSARIASWLKSLSAGEIIAYVEADYLGGAGDQCAVAWRDETEVLPPTKGKDSINQALRLLGVRAASGQDEFDTVWLGRHRTMEGWVDEGTYHVRYVASDTEKKFSHLFLWDMAFDAAETRVLHVVYQVGMSQAAGTTNKDTMKKYEKPWHAALAQCTVEHFYYVTETGKSWAGPIEHATFRVVTGPWEDCFQKRPLIPEEGDLPQPKPNQEWWEYGFPLKAGAIYQHIEPDGWKCEAKAGTTSWEYRPYKPGPPIAFLYYIVSFPRSAADCESWVRHVLGPKPDKADLAELREIAAAFYEIAPRSASAKKFVEQQIWYHPKEGYHRREGLQEAPLYGVAVKPQAAKNIVEQRTSKNGMREEELDADRREVLARLDAFAKANGH